MIKASENSNHQFKEMSYLYKKNHELLILNL